MGRVGDLERAILDLKLERRSARQRLQSTLETMQQLLSLDADQEASELPITSIFRASQV